MLKVKRISHVAVAVPDLDDALGKFFAVLGLVADNREVVASQQGEAGILPLGAAAIAVGSVPAVSSAWKDLAPRARRALSARFSSAPITGTTVDWGWIDLLSAFLVCVILLMSFIFRQCHG